MNILDKIPNEPKLNEMQAKGTRIMAGRLGLAYYKLQEVCLTTAACFGFSPIVLPTVEPLKLYVDKMNKVGPEVQKQMYVFKDKGERDLCLRPEGTAICQLLAQSTYKTHNDLKVCYWQKCFRYEQPQEGRYREFTQFGAEILNQKENPQSNRSYLISMAELILEKCGVLSDKYTINHGVKRGLGLYNDSGFEFVYDGLGAQKQIIGGGPYDNGIGFGIGIDRILLIPGVIERLTIGC